MEVNPLLPFLTESNPSILNLSKNVENFLSTLIELDKNDKLLPNEKFTQESLRIIRNMIGYGQFPMEYYEQLNSLLFSLLSVVLNNYSVSSSSSTDQQQSSCLSFSIQIFCNSLGQKISSTIFSSCFDLFYNFGIENLVNLCINNSTINEQLSYLLYQLHLNNSNHLLTHCFTLQHTYICLREHENEFATLLMQSTARHCEKNEFEHFYRNQLAEVKAKILFLQQIQLINMIDLNKDYLWISSLIDNFCFDKDYFLHNLRENEEDENNENNIYFSIYLHFISWISAHDQFNLSNHFNIDNLFTSIVHLLKFIQQQGKNNLQSVFTPRNKLSEITKETSKSNEFLHPLTHAKCDLISIIANLSFNQNHIRNLASEMEIVPIIMDNTAIDANSPLTQQWALFALRNLCLNHAINSKFIQEMKLQDLQQQQRPNFE